MPADHDLAGRTPALQQIRILVGACWLNLREACWRLFYRAILAGQSFANDEDIAQATTIATKQLKLPGQTVGLG